MASNNIYRESIQNSVILFFCYTTECLLNNKCSSLSYRYEFGPALFIGWAGAAMAILGGALLCCSCPKRETSYPPPRGYHKNAPSAPAGKDYV